MKKIGRRLLIIAAIHAVLLPLLWTFGGGQASDFDFQGVARIPVQHEGRVKPLDTVARNALLLLRGRQSFYEEGQKISAINWLLDVMVNAEGVEAYQVFRIDHPDVLALIGKGEERKYFSIGDLRPHFEKIQQLAQQAFERSEGGGDSFQSTIMALWDKIYIYLRLSHSLSGASAQATAFAPLYPHQDFLNIMKAYRTQDVQAFERSLLHYQKLLHKRHSTSSFKASLEETFNRFHPFFNSILVYTFAFIFSLCSWLFWPASLQRIALMLVRGAFIMHTVGLVLRMYIEGRPPVTNLYSSAVFVGWGAVLISLILERITRTGLGTIVAALVGGLTLIIAHHLAVNGDTMEVMRAVLNSNFWLGTHVVTITIGYSAAFLAGFLACCVILRSLFGAGCEDSQSKVDADMVYGVICVALFFSFIGTILGGVWADQSWGRFWGWDPKENGALLLVLWNAIILHARWGRFIGHRGLMMMAVAGNIVTSFSWFGVNLLGVGLHSYGFMEGSFFWLIAFMMSQLVVIGLAGAKNAKSAKNAKNSLHRSVSV